MGAIHKLSALQVEAAKKGRMPAGAHCDGGMLWLKVGNGGAASWTFRHTRDGRRREVGLGSLSLVSLAAARQKASALREQLGAGITPAAARLAKPVAVDFKVAAEKYLSSKVAGFKNAKHRQQWGNTLATYAYPVIGRMNVSEIGTSDVLRVLQPIWTEKNETASRVRGRIERILAWCAVNGHRTGPNPAQWRGHLAEALPARSVVQTKDHHAALAYTDMPALMKRLASQDGVAALALRFLILTAARTSEVLHATWDEVDLTTGIWRIPAERMKARKPHEVPLTAPALAILATMHKFRDGGEFIFPGARPGKSLSNMSMAAVLKRMDRADITVHGMRSAFREWAGEKTSHQREVIEHALAHQLRDKAEAAYQRGTLFPKRVALMSDWAAWLSEQVINEPGSSVERGVINRHY